MSEPQPPVSFAETVYALSKVIHVVKYRNDISDTLNDHQRKHLRLLDDIALLLVTECKSDVAAVSLERISSGVRFYYAKNRPETDDDREHIHALRDLVRGAGDATERIDKILCRVIDDCGPKLLSRLQKLKLTIQRNEAGLKPYLFGDQDNELHEYYQINCAEWYGAYESATQFLTDFLTAIVKLGTATKDSSKLLELLRIAHVTGAYKQESSPPHDGSASNNQPGPIFVDKELGQRMRLFGDYYGAAKRLVKHHDFAASRQSDEITIEFIPVPVVPQQVVAMPKDYLKILNRFAAHKDLPEASYKTLLSAYVHRTDPPTCDGKPTQSVTHSVHAECTLAVHLASLGRAWSNIEIGCSKGSCWLCESYLKRNQAGLAFHVRNVHGKLQPGWTMPPGGDAHVQQYITTLVESEVVEVMHKAHNSKRGDSEPRSESDEEGRQKVPARIGKPSWARG